MEVEEVVMVDYSSGGSVAGTEEESEGNFLEGAKWAMGNSLEETVTEVEVNS